MKTNNNQTWISDRDLLNDPLLVAEANAEVSPIALEEVLEDNRISELATNRRDFLKVLGFGISAATIASCEIPVKRAIPYVIAPDTIVLSWSKHVKVDP